MSFDKLEDKILKTKADIEQEFKDLRFIHQHTIIDNSKTIYKQTHLNGSFKETYLIMENDDIYIDFPHKVFIPSDLSSFWKFYEENRETHNILIDSRLSNYIGYAVIKYEDDILIYDVYSCKVITIYQFASNFFNVQTNEITIYIIKQVYIGYLLFMTFAKSFNFEWNAAVILKKIKAKDFKTLEVKSPDLNLFDVLINCIKVKSPLSISTKNVYKVVSLFQKYFSEDAFTTETAPKNINQEWKLNNVQDYEFLIALTVLKNNDFHLYGIE